MNTDERSDLEARLRALPPATIPDGLEERLLASIPAVLPKWDRSLWLRRIGTMAAAAGLLVAAWLWYRAAFTVPFRLASIHELVNVPAPTAPVDLDLGLDPLGQVARVGAHELRHPFEWPVRGSIIAHPRDGVIDALLE
jgi:hypothetical protein